MSKEWSTVELLSHARHDWLNKIQLIKGNLALNKMERVKEIIDEIVYESKQESKLSNLHLPQFAALLLTYNWESHSIHLEFEVLEGETNQSIQDELLASWTRAFLIELQQSSKEFHENHLSITIDIQETGLGFFFDFRGIITGRENIRTFLQRPAAFKRKIIELTEQELSLEVFFPYI
ncbi:sporulation initiation phosphotransferase B [Robertmurraya andreesenii]|uniref:Stage 0 sporulation protein B (Sporulation initiation phosphotransferase) n=1 Tax=Anoxybacillus andreesenii TaxID=1325932 RepID=A0ABT9V591_9BACL|nr:sporulation initiation phosphotransferase B [Robertmurraya andreesenii]MDQ0156104.1 stage 0 sporulation protein B (sporulation initiation phosphotransferase) [Robertmurraya andreesenii]